MELEKPNGPIRADWLGRVYAVIDIARCIPMVALEPTHVRLKMTENIL